MANDLVGYLGIDPGVSGGLALIDSLGTCLTVAAMPSTDKELWEWLSGVWSHCTRVTAVLEQVGGFMAGHARPGSAMFRFGASYGAVRMGLIAAEIPFRMLTPQQWLKYAGLGGKRPTDNDTRWKNRLKSRAQELFPDVKITLKTADALLLADCCRQLYTEPYTERTAYARTDR